MRSFSDGDKENVFFYANQDARYYDQLEEFTQPHIDLIHDTMVELIVYSLTGHDTTESDRPFHILNVASGTGAETFRLLRQFKDVSIVAVDFSPPMNRELRRKFAERYPDQEFASRVTLIENDIFGDACSPEALISMLPNEVESCGFDAVVGGLFLHHYPVEKIREFYRRAHAVLKPGGVLVLCEAISFESQSLSHFAHDYGEQWMRKQFTDPDENLRNTRDSLGKDAERLCTQWIRHWNTEHVYIPDVTIHCSPLQDHHESTATHAALAVEAGFQEVGFPFRLWEAAVLWAKA